MYLSTSGGKGGFLGGSVVKSPPANAGDSGSVPGSGRYPGEGKSQGQRSLAGHSPWGGEESDTAERLNNSDEEKVISTGPVSC